MSPARYAPERVTVRVPAKINLELVVGARRPDGYHDVATVFHAVSLYDEVTVTRAKQWSVQVRGPYADLVPTGTANLALQAAQRLADASSGARPVAISVDKEIPVAAGMAGGSADAAAALVACDVLWGVDAERTLLHSLAAQLGSDVNFALTGGTAIGSGRGERVAAVLGRGRYHWVLAVSDEGLSTPDVFAECDRLRQGQEIPAPTPSAAMMTALRSGQPAALADAMANDLQEAAFSLRPALRDVLDAGLEYGALGGVVSGSGPTIAFLVNGAEGALDLAVALTASGAAYDVKRVVGPVHGAHLVDTVRAT